MQNLQEKSLFKKRFSVSQIFPNFFKIINIHEDPRNNKSIESDLSTTHKCNINLLFISITFQTYSGPYAVLSIGQIPSLGLTITDLGLAIL